MRGLIVSKGKTTVNVEKKEGLEIEMGAVIL